MLSRVEFPCVVKLAGEFCVKIRRGERAVWFGENEEAAQEFCKQVREAEGVHYD